MTAPRGGLVDTIGGVLPKEQKRRIRAAWSSAWLAFVKRFRSYGPAELLGALRRLGIAEGDSVMMHTRLSAHNGFTGRPQDVIACVKEAIGPEGHLLMVSLPYRGSTRGYLDRQPRFDVRRTPSQMGLVTEIFRRQADVVRSLSPTHPVLAYGPRARWFVAGHEDACFPCGDETPFSRLAEVDGKILFFDLRLRGFTFMHHVEHVVRDRLPVRLYDEVAVEVPVVDSAGRETRVRVQPFSSESAARRRRGEAQRELLRRAETRHVRVGNTALFLVAARDAIRVGRELAEQGRLFTADAVPHA